MEASLELEVLESTSLPHPLLGFPHETLRRQRPWEAVHKQGQPGLLRSGRCSKEWNKVQRQEDGFEKITLKAIVAHSLHWYC
jgi:hypothetical protein